MSIPLSLLHHLPLPAADSSLGDLIAQTVTDSGKVNSLLDCLCTTTEPAIHSPEASRPPLSHQDIHVFVSNFVLPSSSGHQPLGPNDRIMVVLPTGPENALALLALASYHTCAPVNASCTASELKEDAERLHAKAVVTTKDAEERLELRTLAQELGCDVVYVEGRTSGPAGLFDMSLLNESRDPSDISRKPTRLHGLHDQSLVLHTSGTSGKKKVVPYTLRSLIVGTSAVIQSWALGPTDVNMNMMPLFHVGGIVRNLLAPIMSGGSTIMCSGFDAIAFWSLATELKATWYYAAPTLHHAILASRPDAVLPSRDLCIRMICNAAGGLLPSLAIQLRDTFGGATVLPSYGMTECMPIATPPQAYELERPGCSGIACGPYLSIRDPSNNERELPRGKTGAVSVRGLPTFDGYEVSPDINVPLDTSAFSSEGWFDSGDMGYMDDDGYLYITGRSKEIINKGGEVISPFEIEESIMTVAKHRVKTTLAFAIEHDVLQETIGVIIVPVPDQPHIGLSELQDLLRENLHPSKWPHCLVFMNDLPKNSAGKPLRIKLATRLGLGCLTDAVPAFHRHFHADVPDKMASLSDPIPCSRVSLELQTVEKAILDIAGVDDVAIRMRQDGSAEAIVSVEPTSTLDASQLKKSMAAVLPGYCIPDPLYVTSNALTQGSDGVDFDSIVQDIKRQNAAVMSQRELAVRGIIAELLLMEAGIITPESDFFLLGGNSLLLGKLAYMIRKQLGANVGVAALFTNSTVRGISELIRAEEEISKAFMNQKPNHNNPLNTPNTLDSKSEVTTLGYDYDLEDPEEHFRGQNHPVSLMIQAIPFIFFYPLKAAVTWTFLLFILSAMSKWINTSYWERVSALLVSIIIARLASRIVCPIASIIFKWVVIGRYKPGEYIMWSNYHLRWWIVDQSLRSAGRGIFGMHPTLEIFYYRLLGAHIGKNVVIDKKAKLGEFDLLTLCDGCRIDKTLVRGFCVERDGYFRLGPIVVGRKAVINTFTPISPGAVIADGAIYGPHASSHEDPSPKAFAAYNRTMLPKPHWALQVFIAWPIILIVNVISYIPWFAALWLMLDQTVVEKDGWNSMEIVIHWFASPQRIVWHTLSRVVRALFTPLIRVILGIIVKRLLGLNRECLMTNATQLSHLRRYINSSLLSQYNIKQALGILGTHYEATSVLFRCMGAKVGKRVYWPGSGVHCPDPELLDIGDDVVFGSRSELFTSDRMGSARISIGAGAMIADRVVLLPGTVIGRRTVMGSGSLSRRDTEYEDGSTWMGNDHGEAICFNGGSKDADPNSDTTTPFGRAFHKRQANFFVFPYFMLVIIHILVATTSAIYWSVSAVAAAQMLRQLTIHFRKQDLFGQTWYRIGTLYGLIALAFIIVLNIQAFGAMFWVVLSKWMIIGRRHDGRYEWDKSSYCQRWQLHLVVSRVLYKGYGNGGVLASLTGSAYMVWFYRAMGSTIGRNCAVWAGGKVGLLTEPDLVQLGDDVALDDCSVVAHINSRGNFALNSLKIGDGCALRAGSRLLSGASMENSSMLLEHTLLTSGEIAESGMVYVGWPAKPVESTWKQVEHHPHSGKGGNATLMCPMCRQFPKLATVTPCGHIFCESCITGALEVKGHCPVCLEKPSPKDLIKVYPSFAV